MSEAKTQGVLATCPDCGQRLRLQGTIRIGQQVVCSNCDAELEVIETDPVELDWVYDEYEGEEDEDDDDW